MSSKVLNWKEGYFAFLCSLHERLGAQSPAQLLNQWNHRDIAELVKARPNRWREKSTKAGISEDGLRVSQKEDCVNFVITTVEPIEPGEVVPWSIFINKMDTEGATLRFFGVHSAPSHPLSNDPHKGFWTVRVVNGMLYGPTQLDQFAKSDRQVQCKASSGDTILFVLDRRPSCNTLRMLWNGKDIGIIFDKLPENCPLYPCITLQCNSDVVTADFNVQIPPGL